MVKLVEHLRARQYIVFDAQMQNPHLERFGSVVISSGRYKRILNEAMMRDCFFCNEGFEKDLSTDERR